MTARAANLIRKWRNDAQMTKAELAAAADIPIANINQFESNDVDPTEKQCAAICDALARRRLSKVKFKPGVSYFDALHWEILFLCVVNDIVPQFLLNALSTAREVNEPLASAAIRIAVLDWDELDDKQWGDPRNLARSLVDAIECNPAEVKRAIERLYEIERMREAA